MSVLADLNLKFSEKQLQILLSPASEVWYGGAAGGGKSHVLRMLAIFFCLTIPSFNAYLFRRHRLDLVNTHVKGQGGFRELLSTLVDKKLAKITKEEIRFYNNSNIILCHCKDADDVTKYRSAEMHALLIDEAADFSEEMYRFLRSRSRASIDLKVPDYLSHKIPFICKASNPGGLLHHYLLTTYYEEFKNGNAIYKAEVQDGGRIREFIPSLLTDNKYIDSEEYAATLKGLGSEELVRMYLYGDMTVTLGAYFPEFTQRLVVPDFTPPSHWMRFRAIDWGFRAPSCVLWFAVADGTVAPFKSGDLVAYRELYTTNTHAENLADVIREKSVGENISYTVVDPAMYRQQAMLVAGPSLAEIFNRRGVPIMPADNSRLAGWMQVRQRFTNDAVWFCESCKNTIRVIPLQQYSNGRNGQTFEDLDTKLEDHAVDTVRYACMSRPFTYKLQEDKPLQYFHSQSTFNELMRGSQINLR